MIEINDIEGFEWDEGNKQKNFLKHSVSDKEAEEVFNSHPFIVLRTAYLNEERFQMFGESKQRLLTIIFTIRKNKIRIIFARDMSKK
ncbi:MAG: BrnT family toxin [Ignavibacteria bacterium]|nr:BrnT family toxin [Ignavibacteria bacterium]